MNIFKFRIHTTTTRLNNPTLTEFTIAADNDIDARATAVRKWQQLWEGYPPQDKPALLFCTCQYMGKLDN